MSAQGIGYAAAIVLACAFALAAVSKLRDLRGTLADFTALGVPSPRLFAQVMPLAELAITALLLIVPAVGGIAALITLAFFTVFLASRLRAGVHAPCACFGAMSVHPLSAVDLVRNVGLALLAAAALMPTRPGGVHVIDAFVVGLAVVLGLAILRLLRSR